MARDKHYPQRQFRISDEIYKILKEKKEKDQISWNLFFKELVKIYEKDL